jgi:hypothetical protein
MRTSPPVKNIPYSPFVGLFKRHVARCRQAFMLILLCCTVAASAQKKSGAGAPAAKGNKTKKETKVNLAWGDTFQIPNHYTSLALLGTQNTGYLEVFNRDMKSVILKRHDWRPKAPDVNTISLDILPTVCTSELFVTIKGKTYWIYSNWEKESSVERVYAREIDFEKLTLLEQKTVIQFQDKLSSFEKPLLHEDPRIVLTQMPGYNSRKYQFALSPDSNTFSIKYTLKPSVKEEDKLPEAFGITLFDENLKSVKVSRYTMPYAKELIQVVDYQLDVHNEPCFLVKVFDNPKSNTGPEGKHHFEVFHFTEAGKKADIVPVVNDDKYMKSIRMYKDLKNQVICAGIYSKDEAASEEGVYLARADWKINSFVPYRKGTYAFPSEQKAGGEAAHAPPAKKQGAKPVETLKTELGLKYLWFYPNGSVTIASEEQAVSEIQIPGKKGKTESQPVYHYHNIVLMNIDSAGTVVWFKKIAKSQSGKEKPGEMSYDVSSHGNELLLLFMDEAKNINLHANQAPVHFTDGAGGTLVFLQIDATGKETKGILFDSKLRKQTVFPSKLLHLSASHIMGMAVGEETETCFFVQAN